jgi:hypothetical protein
MAERRCCIASLGDRRTGETPTQGWSGTPPEISTAPPNYTLLLTSEPWFKVDTSGKETVLHAFTGPPDGAYPIGGLIRDKNGNLYGTTNSGGDMYCNYPYGCGTAEPCSRWIRAASRPYCTALLGRLMAHSRSHDGKSAVAA